MPYVRTKGNQVLLVHGARNADTRTVEQQTIFTFYTRAEALAATGEHQLLFRHLLIDKHPELKFDWPALDSALLAQLDHLPDLPPAHLNKMASEFREALVQFARVTWELNPPDSHAAAEFVDANRTVLELVQGKLRWILTAPRSPTDGNAPDSPSLWHQAAKSDQLPLEGWEQLEHLWETGEYAKAEALAGLLAEAFPHFADAHSYLGEADMWRGDASAALEHFRTAEVVGRKRFPKRIAKSNYWRDHATRPFLRAVMYQVHAHSALGNHAEALALCDRLQIEYGMAETADNKRMRVRLNAGSWTHALALAERLAEGAIDLHIVAALAAWELGEYSKARLHFLRCALQVPSAIAVLLGVRLPKGCVLDIYYHNRGVDLLQDTAPYRSAHASALRALRRFWSNSVVAAAILDADRVRQDCVKAWQTGDDNWLAAKQRRHSLAHAREVLAHAGFAPEG